MVVSVVDLGRRRPSLSKLTRLSLSLLQIQHTGPSLHRTHPQPPCLPSFLTPFPSPPPPLHTHTHTYTHTNILRTRLRSPHVHRNLPPREAPLQNPREAPPRHRAVLHHVDQVPSLPAPASQRPLPAAQVRGAPEGERPVGRRLAPGEPTVRPADEGQWVDLRGRDGEVEGGGYGGGGGSADGGQHREVEYGLMGREGFSFSLFFSFPFFFVFNS